MTNLLCLFPFANYHSDEENVSFGALGTLTKNVKPVFCSMSATEQSADEGTDVDELFSWVSQ